MDYNDYFLSRINQDFSATGANKFEQLQEASKNKIAELATLKKQQLAQEEANKKTWVGQAGLDPNSIAGWGVDTAGNLFSGAVKLGGQLASALPNAIAGANQSNLSEEDIAALNRQANGTATPEDLVQIQRKIAPKVPVNPNIPDAQAKAQALADANPNAPTPAKLFKEMNDMRAAASAITKATDFSHVFQKDQRQQFSEELKATYESNAPQVGEGVDAIKAGDFAGGSQDVVAGVAKLIAGAGVDVLSNKRAATSYIFENIPQLLLGVAGKGLMTTSNVGYAMDIHREGIQNYQAKNNGALPPQEVRDAMALQAASLAIAEQAGDVIGLGATKLGLKTVNDAATAGFKQSILNAGKAATTGLVTEAPTEGYQTYAEGQITGKPATGAEIFEGAVIGGVAGAGMTGGGRAAYEAGNALANRTPSEAKPDAVKAQKASALVDAAIATGDTSALTDPKSTSYAPDKAIAALFGHSQKEDTTPEQKQENLVKANQIVSDLMDLQAEQEQAVDMSTVAGTQKLLKGFQDQLAQIDPTSTDAADLKRKESLTTLVSVYQEQLDAFKDTPEDAKAVAAAKDQLNKTNLLIAEATRNKEQLAKLVTPADEVAQLVSLSTDKTNPEAYKASSQKLVTMAMESPDRLTVEQANRLADDADNSLLEPQRAYLRAMSANRIAENAMRTDDMVLKEILFGSPKGTKNPNVGITKYRKLMASAVTAGNQKAADKVLMAITKFMEDNTAKASLVAASMPKVATKGSPAVQILKNANGAWFINPGKEMDRNKVQENGGLTLHSGTPASFPASVATGAKALEAAVAELRAAYELKFNPVVNSGGNGVQNTSQTSGSTSKSTEQTQSADSQATASASTVASTSSGTSGNVSEGTQESVEPTWVEATQAQYAEALRYSNSTNEADYDTVPGDIAALITAMNDGKEIRIVEKTKEASASTVDSNAQSTESSSVDLESTQESTTATGQKADNQLTKGIIASLKQDFPALNFTALSPDEQATVDSELSSLKQWFSAEIAAVSGFVIQTGKNAAATAYAVTGAIGLNPVLFTGEPTLPGESVSTRIKRTLAHELTHVRDRTKGGMVNGQFTYASETKNSLSKGGWAYNEAKESMDKSPVLARFFGYIMGDKFDAEPYRINRELYAQLHALYATYPELMNEHLPRAYKVIQAEQAASEGIIPDTGNASTATEESVDSSNTGTDAEGIGTGTRRTGIIPAFDVEPAAEGTLLKAVSAAGALFSTYFKQSAKREGDLTERPLATVPSFLSSWLNKTVSAHDFLTVTKDQVTEQQAKAINLFKAKAPQWSKLVSSNLVRWKTKEEYRYKDLSQGLMVKGIDGKWDLPENVKTAIVYSAYAWIVETAGKPFLNTEADINKMLSRHEEHEVTPEEFELFRYAAVRENTLINALGKKAVQALGIKAKSNAPLDMQANLEAALGAHALVLLENLKATALMEVVDDAEPLVKHRFIKLARSNNNQLVPLVKEIAEAARGSSNILDKLFSVESGLTEPTLEAVEFTQKVTDTGMGIPQELQNALQADNAEPNFLKQDDWNAYSQLDEDIQIQLAGGEVFEAGVNQITEQKPMEARWNALALEVRRLSDFVKYTLTDKTDTPFFFQHEVWNQQRVGIKNNAVNPQMSKVHRHLIYRSSWESKVNFDNRDEMDNYKLRVMEGLGIKTGNEWNATSLARFDGLFDSSVAGLSAKDTVKADVLIAAVDVMVQQLAGAKLTREQQETLLAGVKAGKEKMHSYDALMTVAKAHYAMSKGEPYFTSTLMGEIDGVSNGPILSHLLLGAAATVEDLQKFLRMGGFYDEASGHVSYNQWRSEPGNLDLYETITRTAVRLTQAEMQPGQKMAFKYAAISRFLGNLMEGDTVTSAGRNLSKDPVRPLVFGSGLGRAIQSMSEAYVGSVYAKLKETATANNREKFEVLRALNVLLYGAEPINTNISGEDLLNIQFTGPQVAAIKKSFVTSFGKKFELAIKQELGTFLERRDQITKTAGLTFGLFNAAYKAYKEDFVAKLIAEGKMDTDKNGNPAHDLTAPQEKELMKLVQKMYPMMHTAMSKQDKNLRAGLPLVHSDTALSQNPIYSAEVHMKGSGGKDRTIRPHSIESAMESPGVRPVSMPIHSFDSAVSHRSSSDGSKINLHDAQGTGLNDFDNMGYSLNKALWDSAVEYSPAEEVYLSLERVVNNLAQVIGTPNAPINLNKYVAEAIAETDGDLLNVLTQAKEMAFTADTLRLSTLAETVAIDQYSNEGSQFEPTVKEREVVKAKLEKLSATVHPSTASNAALIFSVVEDTVLAVRADKTQANPEDAFDDAPAEDEATPVTPMDQVNTYNTMDVFMALDTGAVTPSFRDHLAELLVHMVERLHGPYGTFKEALMKDQALTPMAVWQKALATGVAPMASKIQTSGFQMNDQVLYVIEQVEATVRAAIDNNDMPTKEAYKELVALYSETRERLKPKDFHDGDWVTATQHEQDKAQDLYDFIFKLEKTNGDRSDYLSRFAALGLAHPQFNKLLQVSSLATGRKVVEAKTFAERLQIIFENILGFFHSKITHTFNGQNADARLKTLVGALVDIEAKHKAAIAHRTDGTPIGTILDVGTGAMRSLRRGVRNTARVIADSDLVKNSSSGIVQGAGAIVGAVAKKQIAIYTSGMQQLYERHSADRDSLLNGLINDIRGPKEALVTRLREVKHKLENMRKSAITTATKMALEGFKDQGSKLTDAAKGSITSVFLRTGAHNLFDKFGTTGLETLLSDPKALASEITAYERQLTGPFAQYFVAQARTLGYYLATEESVGEVMMMNTHNIARLYGTGQEAKQTEADAKAAQDVLDLLVPLYALSYSDRSHIQRAADVLRSENQRTDGNGVEFILKLHKQLEDESKQKLFSGKGTLMQFGYTPEIVNSNVDVVTVTEDEGKELEKQGYVLVGEVPQDPSNPGDTKYLYSLHGAGLMPYLSGIMSLTSLGAKGSKAHSGYMNTNTYAGTQNAALHATIANQKQAAINKMFANGASFDPRKQAKSHMVPVFNEQGEVVNWRYMMKGTTRDNVLERDNRFERVLGVLAGSVYDKQTTPVQNKASLKALKAMYDAEFAKESHRYVRVSADSPDPELREYWNLLPDETKKDAVAIFGDEGVMLRKDSVDIVFGYRKNSAANLFRKANQERKRKAEQGITVKNAFELDEINALQKIAVAAVEAVLTQYARVMLGLSQTKAEEYAQRSVVVVSRGERMWQEIVRETKDNLVVKSASVLLGNVRSNISQLVLFGVPPQDMVKYHLVAMKGATAYLADKEELEAIKLKLATGYTGNDKAKLQHRQQMLENEIARNPVTELIEGGLLPTIVEDVGMEEDPYSYKSALTNKIDEVTSKVNPTILSAARTVYMTRDTKLYKALSRTTQLSDFVARYTLYQHSINKKEEPLSKEDALHQATEAFVFYDAPMQSGLQYLDDMGFTMFTKYFLRIQRVLQSNIQDNPTNFVTMLLLNQYMNLGPIVLDSSMLAHAGNNPIKSGAFQYFGSLDDLATVKAGMALLK